MGWQQDKMRLVEWLLTALIGTTVGLLCYEANIMAEDIKASAIAAEALKARVDLREGRDQVNDQLLQEVRNDVKELLNRTAR